MPQIRASSLLGKHFQQCFVWQILASCLGHTWVASNKQDSLMYIHKYFAKLGSQRVLTKEIVVPFKSTQIFLFTQLKLEQDPPGRVMLKHSQVHLINTESAHPELQNIPGERSCACSVWSHGLMSLWSHGLCPFHPAQPRLSIAGPSYTSATTCPWAGSSQGHPAWPQSSSHNASGPQGWDPSPPAAMQTSTFSWLFPIPSVGAEGWAGISGIL